MHRGVHRPQPALPQVPAAEHGRQLAPDLRRLPGGGGGRHGRGGRRVGGCCRLHSGPVFSQGRPVGSAGGPTNPKTREFECFYLIQDHTVTPQRALL